MIGVHVKIRGVAQDQNSYQYAFADVVPQLYQQMISVSS
jgi:hypothetical protein